MTLLGNILMAIEIERKFLVRGDAWRQEKPLRFSQGYLNRDRERTVRVRLAGDTGFLTIKGATAGVSRLEFEYSIPAADAQALLALADGPLVEKLRHIVMVGNTRWEVDEFLGDNAGLVVAEVELEHEEADFARPEWLGDEVSDDARYFNANLAAHPYKDWKESRG